MRLRIRHKDGLATLTTLTPQSTLQELLDAIAKEIKTPSSHLELKSGYPPKLITGDDPQLLHAHLESLGVRDGDQILTSERPGAGPGVPSGTTSTSTLWATNASIASSSTSTGSTAPVPANQSAFAPVGSGSFGFGSAPVVQARTSGASFGGLSTVDSSYKATSSIPSPAPATASRRDTVDHVRIRDQGFLVVREIEDDNSCLFNSIAYTLDPTKKSDIPGLRAIVARAIEANPDDYSDVVLGRPRKEYCDWIQKKNSWGGAIGKCELAIFADHYKVEIDSIDVSTNRVDRFGKSHSEGKYSQRVLLIYSGIHYDAVALTPGLDIPSDCDQTQFDIGMDIIVQGGIELAAKLKAAHKYTDLATFTLRCS
ncbi:ubiquitin-specific protease otu1, partial [Podila epigama]